MVFNVSEWCTVEVPHGYEEFRPVLWGFSG